MQSINAKKTHFDINYNELKKNNFNFNALYQK